MNIRKWEIYAQRHRRMLWKQIEYSHCVLNYCERPQYITCHYVSKGAKIRPAIPSQQGCTLLCASEEASAEPVSHDGAADPV